MKNEAFYGTDMVGGGYANRTHDADFKGQSLTTWRIPYVEFQTRIELALATWKDADLTVSPLERVLLYGRNTGEKY